MNLYQLNNLIETLRMRNETELLNYYEKKKSELIKKINAEVERILTEENIIIKQS